MVSRGMTMSQMAEECGCGKALIRKRLKAFGLKTKAQLNMKPDGSFTKRPFASLLDVETVGKMYGSGLSTIEIGDFFSVSKNAVVAFMKRNKISARSGSEAQKLSYSKYSGKGFKKGNENPAWGKVSYCNHIRGRITVYSGVEFKSSYEAAFAQWCDKNKKKWQYEPKRFDLGVLTYAPDFLVDGEWIEIKGWMTPRGKKSINLFRKKVGKIQVLRKKDLIKMGVLSGNE